MKSLMPPLAMAILSVFAQWSFAQQQRKYDVDPKTKWAAGAKPTPADELKRELDAGTTHVVNRTYFFFPGSAW